MVASAVRAPTPGWLRVEAREQLEAGIPAPRGVRGSTRGLELRQARPAEELGASHEPIIQGDGVEAIFHHGADADEPHAVREERPKIAGGGIRHPDRGETIVAQQIEDVQGVAPIGLRLTHDHRANLGGIADEQHVSETLHQSVEPDGVPGALNTHRDRPGNAA
jgi:hypothetical protein